MEKLFHYTSLDTLALILKNKSIRFNSLSNVDDLEEAVDDDGKNIGNSVLVSCWTDMSDENIPLWKMYSNDFCGCRIELEKNFFKVQERFPASDEELIALTEISKENGGIVLIPQDFYNKINYTKTFSERRIFEEEEKRLNINFLGREKKEEWAFQSEYRFYLQQFPIVNNLKSFEYRHTDFYLELKEESLSNIIVRLGPKCNDGHKLIADALIKEYTLNGTVEWSGLKGKIK